jgi:hypothetical protein
MIIRILKPGKPMEETESYRPIALYVNPHKSFERIILTQNGS